MEKDIQQEATPEYKVWLERCLTLTDLTKSERADLESALERVNAELQGK